MTSSVIEFKVIESMDEEANKLLDDAKGKLSQVLILGFTLDGNDYCSSSKADAGSALFFIERAKHNLMKTIDELIE